MPATSHPSTSYGRLLAAACIALAAVCPSAPIGAQGSTARTLAMGDIHGSFDALTTRRE